MSIVTDTLNRLQAERTQRSGQSGTSATSENAEAAGFLDLDFFSPHPPASALRNHLPSVMVLLGGIGVAAYLWGLPHIAAPVNVTPEQGTVKESNSAKPVLSRIVEGIPEQGEDLFTAPVTEENKDSGPVKAGLSPNPPARTTSPVAKDAPASEPQSSPGNRSTAKPTLARNAHSVSSGQRENRSSPRLRNATTLQVSLARAQYFITLRQYARAVTALNPLFVLPPESWEPWFWLGTAQLGLGQWEKARTSLVEGLARDATVPQLWVQRALVSQQEGRFGEALDALRQAELLAPQLPEVQLNLAYALEVAGDRLVAVKHYRTFLTLTEGKKAYHATRKKVLDRISRLSKT